MGGGSWTTQAHESYSFSRGRSVDSRGSVTTNYKSVSQAYTTTRLHDDLNPKNVIRECVDSTEHPETLPVILALDVTGSMGRTAIEVSKQLGVLMKNLFGSVKDIEFSIMGIGDTYCDAAPIQMSQFESDIRIAENLDKIYFEAGGGGNGWESYTAAWYMGLHHAKLDCWNRGKKGIIITMGDEPINPCLRKNEINRFVGDSLEADVGTAKLYKDASEKYHIYHIVVDHSPHYDAEENKKSFAKYVGEEHVKIATVEEVVTTITEIITNIVSHDNLLLNEDTFASADGICIGGDDVESGGAANVNDNGEITW